MQTLNQLIADNLLVVALLLVILILFGKKKVKRANIPDIDFDADLDSATAEPEPKPTSSKLQTFISLWPEVYMIPLLFAVAALINYGLMQLFPDAIFLGPEQIQTILYKTIASFMAYFLFFIRLRLDFKEIWQWYTGSERKTENSTLNPWQKRISFLVLLSVFVLVFALV